MEKEELDFTLFVFDPAKPGPYEQYIMPHISGEMKQEPEHFAAVGASWNHCAIGAAVITEDPDEPGAAAVVSLFVDPEVRRRGVGTALLAACAKAAAEAGAEKLTISYTLDGEDLEAMDLAVRAMGGVPEFRRPVFTMSSTDFRDSRLVGRAFRPDYRRQANIVRFLDLTPEQLEALHENPDAPWYNPWMQPELSLAYLHEGRVAAFMLGRISTPGSYAVQGIWKSSSAPFNTIHTLLIAHVNLCYTHAGGGDFLYHCSAAEELVFKLIQTYTEGKYRRFDEHHAELAALSEKLKKRWLLK